MLRANVADSKVIICVWVRMEHCNIEIQWERMEQVYEFKYLACMVNDSYGEGGVWKRSNEFEELLVGQLALVNEKGLDLECYTKVLMPTHMYGRE